MTEAALVSDSYSFCSQLWKVNTSFLLSRDSKCGWRRSVGIDTFGVAISCPGAWVMPQPREHHEDCQRIPPSPSFYGARETTEEKIKLKSTMWHKTAHISIPKT